MDGKALILERPFFQEMLSPGKVCAFQRKDKESCSQPKILNSPACIPQLIPPPAHNQGPFFRAVPCLVAAPLSSSCSPCVAGQGVITEIEPQLNFLQGLSVLCAAVKLTLPFPS